MQRATKASEIGQFMYPHSPYKFHTNVKLSTYLAISQPKCPDWNWMKTALSNKQRTLILWMAEVRTTYCYTQHNHNREVLPQINNAIP